MSKETHGHTGHRMPIMMIIAGFAVLAAMPGAYAQAGTHIELDREQYTWTDRVYITIIAPDHNLDSEQIERIGSDSNPIKISTREADIERYTLEETGIDTGNFTGTVTLAGFAYDADGDGENDAPTRDARSGGTGPTDGFIEIEDDVEGITVSFEFSDNEFVTGSAFIRWNTGNATWDKSSYNSTDTAIFRITDPDMNLDPDAADAFGINVWSDTDMAGTGVMVTETGAGTGIFEGEISFTSSRTSSDQRLLASHGDLITGEYVDYTLPEPYAREDRMAVTGTASMRAGPAGAIPDVQISMDRDVYSWTDTVRITVASQNHNSNDDAIDEIGSLGQKVRVATRGGAIDEYRLTETGADTGIFEGQVRLAGFAHDADGSARTGTDGNDVTGGMADGEGPDDGRLPAGNGDAISASFEYTRGQVVAASSEIKWNEAKASWIKDSYPAQGAGIIRIVDSDMNLDPDTADTLDVDVYSESDVGGIRMTLAETGRQAGIFEGIVHFITEGRSSGDRLFVAPGDHIVAEYDDHTPPAPYTIVDDLDIRARASIQLPANATETEIVTPANSTETEPIVQAEPAMAAEVPATAVAIPATAETVSETAEPATAAESVTAAAIPAAAPATNKTIQAPAEPSVAKTLKAAPVLPVKTIPVNASANVTQSGGNTQNNEQVPSADTEGFLERTSKILNTDEAKRYLNSDPRDFRGNSIGAMLYVYYKDLNSEMLKEQAKQKAEKEKDKELEELRAVSKILAEETPKEKSGERNPADWKEILREQEAKHSGINANMTNTESVLERTARLLNTDEAKWYLNSSPEHFRDNPIGTTIYGYYQDLRSKLLAEQAKQDSIDAHEKRLEELRAISKEHIHNATEEKSQNTDTFSGLKKDIFLSRVDPSVRDLLARQLNHTANVFEEAQSARDAVLEGGGSAEAAWAAYLENISITREAMEAAAYGSQVQAPEIAAPTHNATADLPEDIPATEPASVNLNGTDIRVGVNGTTIFVNVNGMIVEFLVNGTEITPITNSTR